MRFLKIILITSLFFYLLTELSANSWGPKIDSLLAKVSVSKKDSNAVNLYRDISYAFLRQDTDEGIKYGELGLKLAEDIDWKFGIAIMNEVLGINYSIRSDFDTSEEYLRKALIIYKEINNKKKIGNIYVTLAINENYKSDPLRSIEYLRIAEKNYKEIYNEEGLMLAKTNIANAYMVMGDYTGALEQHFEVLDILESGKYDERRSEVLTNIGNNYLYRGDRDKAYEYYQESLKWAIKFNKYQSEATLLNNIGEIHRDRGDLEKALLNFRKAYELNEKVGNIRFMCMNLSNYGIVSSKIGNYKEAIDNINRSIILADSISYNAGVIQGLIHLGEIYSILAEGSNSEIKGSSKVKAQKALEYFHRSLELSQNEPQPTWKIKSLGGISTAFSLLGIYDSALYYYKAKHVLEDSINGSSVKEKILDIETKRKSELDRKQIELLRSENEYHANLNTLLIVIGVLVIVLMILLFREYRRSKNTGKKLEKMVEDRTQELQQAKDQLMIALNKEKDLNKMKLNMMMTISHQFRTPLTVISTSSSIIEMKSEKDEDLKKHVNNVKRSIDDIIELIDNVFMYTQAEISEFDYQTEELDIKELINERIIFKKNSGKLLQDVELEFNGDDHRIISNKKLFIEIFRQILNNALNFSNKDKKIKITINDLVNEISISISDQGRGISTEELEHIFEPFFVGKDQVGLNKGTGIGLSIVKSYTEELGGRIEVDSELGKGSNFTFYLPKKIE